MKRFSCFYWLACLAILASCGNAETKADHSAKAEKPSTTIPTNDTPAQSGKNSAEKITLHQPVSSSPVGTRGINPGNQEILANIDKYLVSTPSFTTTASGSVDKASVLLKNTLQDITFQKVFLEVSILSADGQNSRTDYYVIQNLEPGENQVVILPDAAKGKPLSSHVVKLKSNQLTGGETILVGARYSPR